MKYQGKRKQSKDGGIEFKSQHKRTRVKAEDTLEQLIAEMKLIPHKKNLIDKGKKDS